MEHSQALEMFVWIYTKKTGKSVLTSHQVIGCDTKQDNL